MAERFPDKRMRFLLGDVRDQDRLRRAMGGATIVVHAAALKQVPAGERDPGEFVRTNVLGSLNVVEAAIDCGISRVMGLSSDKACAPVTLYGSTKAVMEKMFLAANETYGQRTAFSVVRYGNVTGSRGSVVPLFMEQAKTGTLTITDPRMSRFWLMLEDAVDFVKRRIEEMHGGELYVPRLPSVRIVDVAKAVAPAANVIVTGIRPGEKLSEQMIAFDESRHAFERPDHYVLNGATRTEPEFVYDSASNENFLSVEGIREALA
jgi:UDP-N-acetylglucosamine 4,6-dehydratase